LESFVRACDETAQIGETPKLYETAFVQYMLNVFKRGPQKRRQAMRADSMLVSLCGLLAFVEKNALPSMTSTERTGGGTSAMRTIALSSMFYEHDRDGDEQLNGSEFRKLIRACAKRENYKLGPQDEDGIEEFMQAFDKDNDGTISHNEWVDFMSTTMDIPKNDRIGKYGHYAMLQQYCFNTVELLERFLKYAVNELTNLLKQARNSKRDKSAPVTPPELQRLVTGCIDALQAAGLPEEVRRQAKDPKIEDLKNCIKFMDKNGDGELQQGEFLESCLKNIMQSSKSRKKATKKIESGKEINAFLAVIRAETQRRVLRTAAGVIFRRFDKSMKGEMTEKGILHMIEGIATHHEALPPWQDHAAVGSWQTTDGENPSVIFGKVFMDVMDEDGDGKLQEEEFVSYMAKTVMKTRAAEETRSGEITFDDFEDQSVNGVTPEQKKLFLCEMLHIIEMDLPYIGV
jgi:Ca2+-binding EF-hand superfamily protein